MTFSYRRNVFPFSSRFALVARSSGLEIEGDRGRRRRKRGKRCDEYISV